MRARTVLVLATLLAGLLGGGPARATNPMPAAVGQMQAYLEWGTSLSSSYYDDCYTTGSDSPQLLWNWGTTGSWEISSWSMTDVWDYAALSVCGYYGGTMAAGQPIGADCLYQSGKNGTGRLMLDGSKSNPRSYTISKAGWKAGSNATMVLLGDLAESNGAPAGQFVALLHAPLALCPSYTSLLLGVWTILPPTSLD